MENKKFKKIYTIFAIGFILINILATYLITTETFNRYVISFDYSFKGVLNSFIGNLTIILLIYAIVSYFTRNLQRRMRILIYITFILNAILFALNVFNRYYGTSFNFKVLSIFQNPSEGFGLTIFYESLREIVTYYRIILFIPFILLLVYYLLTKRYHVRDYFEKKVSPKRIITSIITICMLFVANVSIFSTMVLDKEILESAKATYNTQNLGLYNFLVLDFFGFDYNQVDNDLPTIKKILDKNNKNVDRYTSIIDGNMYNRSVKLKDVENINGKLVDSLNPNTNLTGLLDDYNLVLIHLESFNHLLLENEETNKHLYNLNAILEESYVFNNFYTNVGVGTSFDAELAMITGLLPNGTSTLAWDYDKEVESKNFDLVTLPKLFKESGYVANVFHGNNEMFYNRVNFHPEVLGYDKYYGKETILEELGFSQEEYEEGMDYIKEQYNHDSGMWITDRAVFNLMNDVLGNHVSNEQRFMAYSLLMLPHIPFYYDPYHPNAKETELYDEETINSLDIVTLKYINYVKYYNEIFKVILEDVNGYGDDYSFDENNVYDHKKTAYVFFGDHGSAIQGNDVNYLLGGNLDPLEVKKELLRTTAFIYVPGENFVNKDINGNDVTIKEGLLKGTQDLVRGQTDLHRTIVDLFGLPIKNNDYLFGAHGMSTEKTYSLDNKTLYLVADDFFSTMRNSNSYIINNENSITLEEIERIKAEITKFKRVSDYAMNNNLFKQIKGQ